MGLAYSYGRIQAARDPAADLWRRTLAEVPTVFGRLVYLASLCDHATGRYFHLQLSRTFGVEDADRTLRRCHQQVFTQWLTLSLAEQRRDFEEFVCCAGQEPEVHDIAPSTARDVERQLCFTDLEILLELRKAARTGFSLVRGA